MATEAKFDGSDIIFVEDVIQIMGGKVTKGVIYGLVREKKLPAFKAGKRYLFSRTKVEAFISKRLGIAN